MKKLLFLILLTISSVAFSQAHYDSTYIAGGDSLSSWFYTGNRETNQPTQKHLTAFFIDSVFNITTVYLEVSYDTLKPYQINSSGSELSFTVDTTHNWAITPAATDIHPYDKFRFKFNTHIADSTGRYIKYETRSY